MSHLIFRACVDCAGCCFSFAAEHHDEHAPGRFTCPVCGHKWQEAIPVAA